MDMIAKKDLEDCAYYKGYCRNARIALWDAKKDNFVYIRYSFGFYSDTIEHFEDVKDKGVDGFIPIEKIEKFNHEEIIELKKKVGY